MADDTRTLPHKLIKDLRGQRFGRLIVREFLRRHNKHTHWLCDCDCGRRTEATSGNLVTGVTRSCGCRRSAVTRERSFKHGQAQKTAEYRSWAKMKERCTSPNCKDYLGYGGRGITVCAEWQTDFQAFFEHIGPKPTPQHSIDRIDNNGHYEPGNVRWATPSEQAFNRRPKSF